MSFLKFLKSHSKELEVSSFNNIKWIGFFCLIKLRFCMDQNVGYFNKAILVAVFKKIATRIDEHIMLSYLL